MKKLLLVMFLTIFPVLAHGATTLVMVPGDSWSTKLAQLNPGDTLQLADGTYSPVVFFCGQSGIKQGNSTGSITIKAANERKARIYTDGTRPAMAAYDCQYWNFVGLMFESGDSMQSDDSKGSLFIIGKVNIDSHHVKIQRNLFYHPNTLALGGGIDIAYGLLLGGGNNNYLIEENEWYDDPGPRALLLSTYGGNQYGHTIRRNYMRNRVTSGTYSSSPSINCYFCRNTSGIPTILENNIGENAAFGGYGGDDIRFYGNISNNIIGTAVYPNLPGQIGSKAHNDRDYGKINHGMIGVNNLGINTLYGSSSISVTNVNITHYTSIGHILYQGQVSADTSVSNDFDARKGGQACYSIVGGNAVDVQCANQYDMTVVFKDSMILNGAGEGIAFYDTNLYTGNPGGLTFSNMNVFGNAQGNYGAGTGGASGTKYSQDPNMGTCRAWIPAGSFNKGKASDGGDIGATILYAYENGVLTQKPLWKADGSWIGCGAIVAGVNDNPATACSGVGTRLNINQNGCPFPAGYTPAGAGGGVASADTWKWPANALKGKVQ